jgi:signal transduction histidine kinase
MRTFAKPGQVIEYHHQGNKEVNTDPVLLTNIVSNLVSNSIKYSPEHTVIRVSSMANRKFHITVSDNGIGIPKEDQKHLFERFYRASNAGTVQGTGLGLHIMKQYVEMLDGNVALQSEVGKGTEVKVTLQKFAK